MQLLFAKSKWEMWHASLEVSLERTYAVGFDTVEIYQPALKNSPASLSGMVAAFGLKLIATINPEGASPRHHRETLRKNV